MNNFTSLVSSDEAVLIFGSLSAHDDDRFLQRESIEPAQLIVDGALRSIPYFNGWGDLGVSSMVLVPGTPPALYFTTGADLLRLRLNGDAQIDRIEIPSLRDVHEMTLIGAALWLANTGYDEAICFDLHEARVTRRIKLEQFQLKTSVTDRSETQDSQTYEEVDRFHCNQVFEGVDGRLYALVHHATGRQLITRVAKKLIKKQGDGGVIDLISGRSAQLWLKAPHTVRIVNGEYWLFDSGESKLNVYDDKWRLIRSVPTAGIGRGADLSGDARFYYVGISEKRKRYQETGYEPQGNMVQVFRSTDCSCVGSLPIAAPIEQINNLYVIPRSLALALLALR